MIRPWWQPLAFRSTAGMWSGERAVIHTARRQLAGTIALLLAAVYVLANTCGVEPRFKYSTHDAGSSGAERLARTFAHDGRAGTGGRTAEGKTAEAGRRVGRPPRTLNGGNHR